MEHRLDSHLKQADAADFDAEWMHGYDKAARGETFIGQSGRFVLFAEPNEFGRANRQATRAEAAGIVQHLLDDGIWTPERAIAEGYGPDIDSIPF